MSLRRSWSRKAVLLACLVAIFALGFGAEPRTVAAEGAARSEGMADATLDRLEDAGMIQSIDEIFNDISGRRISWRDVLQGVLQGRGLDFGALARAIAGSALQDLAVGSRMLGRIMLVGVVIACLDILSRTIAPDGANRVALWASHLCLIAIAIYSFRETLTVSKSAMEALRTAFFAFVPALTGLTMASGAPAAASLLHPLVFSMGTIVSIFVIEVAFPMIYTSIALDLAGSMGGSDRATGVAAMVRQASFISTGVLLACFVGLVVGQRAAAGLADGMAYRTAKYVSSTFVPVAGKLLGDTMDMFFVSARTLRSALGLVGVIAVIGGVFSPLLRVISSLCAWKIAHALLAPLCGKEVGASLKTMSDGVGALGVALLVTCFCFVICLSLVSSAGRPI